MAILQKQRAARCLIQWIHMAENRISEETRARIREAWPDILADIAAGSLIKDALAKRDVTDGQKRAFLASEPNARAQWDEAREASADSYHDEALQLVRDPSQVVLDEAGNPRIDPRNGKPLIIERDAGLVRAHVDTLKWAARIRNPRVYGDKAQLDVNVRTVDLTRIITEANARLEASRMLGAGTAQIIEGEAVRVGQEALEKML